MRRVAQGIGSLLIVVIAITSLLCAPAYCVAVAEVPQGQAAEAHACCPAPESAESPAPAGESESPGGCGACPFMSGTLDSKGASLELPTAKPALLSELPPWLQHGAGLVASCPPSNTDQARLSAQWHEPPPQRACRARLCVYLM